MKIHNTVGNVQLMQKINRIKVLDCIRQKGMVARPEIARITGLSPSSITNIVSYLLEKKLVVEVGHVDSNEVGRKATLLKFNPSASNIIAINVEVSVINIALTDLDGNIIKKKEILLDRIAKDYEILNIIKKDINTLLDESKKLSNSEISGIGVAVPGLVENEDRVLSSSLRWRGLSLKEYFENNFNLPSYVQNSSRTKAISELRNNIDELEKNIIFLDLDMGVGIINFYEGKINEAVIGELGHTSVKKDGPVCFCGNRGCLEVMCSVEAVVNQCSELLQIGKCAVLQNMLNEKNLPLSYDILLEAFENGDNDVSKVFKECGEYLGLGIANIINVFNPQRIIINGDVLLTSDFIYQTAVKEANKRAYEQFTKDLKYEKVNIGVEQSIKGVSLYVTDRLFDLAGPDF